MQKNNSLISIETKDAKMIAKSMKNSFAQFGVMQILECILITVDKTGVLFESTNLENYLSIKVPCISFSGESMFCISAKNIFNFFNNAFSKVVSIQYDNNKCFLCCDNIKIKVEVLKIDNFPKKPTVNNGSKFSFDGKEIHSIISSCFPFLSLDQLRPSLTAINICNYDDRLAFVATDAHKLILKKTSVLCNDSLSALIPRKSCLAIMSVFNIHGSVLINIDSDYIFLESEKSKLFIKKIDERFPNFQSVLINPDIELKIKRSDLFYTLKMTRFFCNNSTKLIRASLNDSVLKITSSKEDNEFNDNDSVSYAEIKLQNTVNEKIDDFGINCDFLFTCLCVNKSSLVSIKHTGIATKGIVIDDEILLMPLIINQ